MAVEPGDANFESKLDEKSKKKAKEELHEHNDKDRAMAVQSFRGWVLQQKWLKTPTDFGFLLRFLRAKKFSQLLARETLENYWTVKTKTPEWFRKVDPADPVLQAILRTGVYLSPKVYDSQGRRVIIEKLGVIDLDKLKKEWGVANLLKVMVLVFDWVNMDENVQVNGNMILADCTDISFSHVTAVFGGDNGKRFLQFIQNSLPARMKSLNIYNEPTFFDAIFAIFAPLLKAKTKDRLCLHGKNMFKVYEKVEKHMLPDEYLPDDYDGPKLGSRQKLAEEMIADMNRPEFRNYILDLSSDKYGVDLKAKDKDVPVASFRKLNVD